MRLAYYLYSGEPVGEEINTEYFEYCKAYIRLVDYGEYVDRSDLEDTQSLFSKLAVRSGTITRIDKKQHYDKIG
jgi:hypothetical protein